MHKLRSSIGIDIQEISRFKKKLDNKLLLSKIFTKHEIKHCFKKNNPAAHLAVRFAAKEAIFKSLEPFKPKQTFEYYKKIEIVNNKVGAPKIKFLRGYQKYNLLLISLSLSHSANDAVAVSLVQYE